MLKKKRFSLKKTDDITDAEINRRRRRSIGGDEGRMLSGVVLSKDEKWNKWREQRIESEDESGDELGRRVGKLKLV